MKTETLLYPALGTTTEPTAPPDLPDIQLLRLQEIRLIRTEIETDLQIYSRCRRRYSSAFNGLNYVCMGLNFLNVAEASTSVGLLTTGIGLPISIGLAVGAGMCSVISVSRHHK